MTAEQLAQAGRDLARRSRARQGLAPVVTDPTALARVAALLTTGVAHAGAEAAVTVASRAS